MPRTQIDIAILIALAHIRERKSELSGSVNSELPPQFFLEICV